MTLILTSPPLAFKEITLWSRNLLDQNVTIDQNVGYKVVEILHFQIVEDDQGYRVVVLVRLFGPLRPEMSDNG